ncbi:GNAT family N-acetyltransferase [Cellulomonas iranensis]|uniref:Ribosomal protein S18 acetylase RimI-like enzyme n=1 Tax=Cellulomonas iranensis TaxID=76862 RepID=A0ABU0GK15_9CELL|nr:GNAT family N-acetyltransferase [Cellulomonas iranensis]MDQ0425259.1 ribosomal protein S18 acetylase RimI-like enzyme [Cellulomonas iranensis]
MAGHAVSAVRAATAADVPAAARVLADAFTGYAWTDWVLPADDHAARLAEVQGLYLAHAVEHGVVLVDDDVRGVVAFVPVDVPPPADEVWHRVAELHGDRIERLGAAPSPEPPAGAWTLATLGVLPAARGAGLGSRLVSEGLDRVGDVPVVLDTSDPRNVTLYRRHGFEVVAQVDVPDGPSVWSMLRRAA